jgi:hypothetical protein
LFLTRNPQLVTHNPQYLWVFKNRGNIFFLTKPDTTGGADTHAGRLFIVRQPFQAQIALHGDFPLVVELHGPEGTGLQTGLTADTEIIIDQNNTLGVSGDGLFRAGLPARGFGTVMAVLGNILRGILDHPYQPRPYPQVMFLLASHFTGMTTHTILLNYIKRNFFHPVPPEEKPLRP